MNIYIYIYICMLKTLIIMNVSTEITTSPYTHTMNAYMVCTCTSCMHHTHIWCLHDVTMCMMFTWCQEEDGFTWCLHGVCMMLTWCLRELRKLGVGVQKIFAWCVHDVCMVRAWCLHGVCMVLGGIIDVFRQKVWYDTWCLHDVTMCMMFTWCQEDDGFTWCFHGVCMMLTWCLQLDRL